MDYKKLINKARKLRQDTFLAFIKKGEAHLGGSFSMIETLLTLYEIIMKKDDKIVGILTGRQKEPLLPINYHNEPTNQFARPPKR